MVFYYVLSTNNVWLILCYISIVNFFYRFMQTYYFKKIIDFFQFHSYSSITWIKIIFIKIITVLIDCIKYIVLFIIKLYWFFCFFCFNLFFYYYIFKSIYFLYFNDIGKFFITNFFKIIPKFSDLIFFINKCFDDNDLLKSLFDGLYDIKTIFNEENLLNLFQLIKNIIVKIFMFNTKIIFVFLVFFIIINLIVFVYFSILLHMHTYEIKNLYYFANLSQSFYKYLFYMYNSIFSIIKNKMFFIKIFIDEQIDTIISLDYIYKYNIVFFF